MILARYTLTLHGPEVHDVADQWERTEARVLADFPARLEAVEEDVSDLLPDGYEIKFEPETVGPPRPPDRNWHWQYCPTCGQGIDARTQIPPESLGRS